MSSRETLSNNDVYDVTVVGAGISGLSAAFHLRSMCSSLKLLVLEAKDRVGGRTLTVEMKSPGGVDVFDLGGQWVSVSQLHIMDLLVRLNIHTYPQFHEGKKFLQLNDKILTYGGSIPALPILSLLDLHWFIYKFDKLVAEIDVNNPYSHPRAEEFDSMTVATYQKKMCYTETTRIALEVALRTTFGFEVGELSLLYVLLYARAAGGLMKLFEATEGSAQEIRVDGGAQQISTRLSGKIGSENVRLSSPVTGIVQLTDEDGDNIVEVHLNNGDVIRSKYVIVAIPPHLIADITFTPPLSDQARNVLTSSTVGHLTKYIATYPKAFWREQGYSGEVVSLGGPAVVDGCSANPVTVVYDVTSSRGSPALVGFLGGEEGKQWCRKSYEVRKNAILNGLSKFFGLEALNPLEYAEKIWSDEAYNGGCPITAPTLGLMKPWTLYFKKPFGRVHWAGTEFATSWSGYMNGAVQTGVGAANDILRKMKLPGIAEEDLRDELTVNIARSNSRDNKSRTSRTVYLLAVSALGVLSLFYLFRPVK